MRLATTLIAKFRATTIRVAKLHLLAAVLVSAALILAFGFVADEVMEGDTHKLDMAVLMALRNSDNPADLVGPAWFEEMVRDVTALGSYAFILIVVLSVFGYLLLVRQYAISLLMAVAVAGGVLISNALKHGFDRPRPELEHAAQVFSPSFPSGHATLSAVTFLTLGGLLTRASLDWRVKAYVVAVAVTLTVLVGLSRVYLGVHYPSDVLAGWSIGTAWALLCWTAAFWLQARGKVEVPQRQ
jgi:undecaprenyl-diphosphatase